MSIIAILGSSRRRRDSYVQVATYFEWIVAPANVSLASIGGTASVLAAVTDQYHRQMPGASQPTITYSSGTTDNITVSGSTLTAVANGTSVITAHAATGGWADITATATVAQVVASASISPTAPSLAFGRTQQFTLVAKDALGVTIASPPSPTWVALSNLDGSAWGTVTSGGLFTASTGVAGNRSGFIHATYPNGVISQNAGISLGTPTLSSIDTTNLPQGSTALSFTLTGTFFGTDATPVVSGLTGVTVADFTVVSATSITGHFSVSASAPIASGTIQVSSVAAGNSGTEAISVTSGVTALDFTSVSPSSAVQGSSSVWQFFSNNANNTTTVVFSVPGDFTVTSYDYTNLALGYFTANVAVGATATIGTDTVHLHDTSATLSDSGNVSFGVVAAVPPTFTSISALTGNVSAAAPTIASTTTKINLLASTIQILSIQSSLAAVTNQAFGALGTIPASKWGIICLERVAAGTVTFTSAAANYTTGYTTEALAIAAIPAVTSGKVRVGYLTVLASASGWIAGTDSLQGGATGHPATTTNYYAGDLTQATSTANLPQNISGAFGIVGTGLNNTQSIASLPFGVSSGTLTCSDANNATVQLTSTGAATLGAANVLISDPLNGSSGTEVLTITAGTPDGTARSHLDFDATVPSTHPTGTLSLNLPLAHANGTPTVWKSLLYGAGSGSGGLNSAFATTLGTPQSRFMIGCVSDPLSTQIIPAGTYTFNYGLYTQGGALYKLAPVVTIWRPSTGAKVGTLWDSSTGIGSDTLNSNTTYGKVATITNPTGIAIEDGDRLIVELYAVGGANDTVQLIYDAGGVPTEGTTGFDARMTPPSPIYTKLPPMGMLEVGPTGISSGTGVIAAVTVASDAEYRSKMIPSDGTTHLWDPASGLGGTASPGVLLASSMACDDLQIVDTTVTFTDRDSTVLNTLHCTIKPNGGAPLSSANDNHPNSSNVPQAAYKLPSGRTITSWLTRRLYRFNPGFRLDCPNNVQSNTDSGNHSVASATSTVLTFSGTPFTANVLVGSLFDIVSGTGTGSGLNNTQKITANTTNTLTFVPYTGALTATPDATSVAHIYGFNWGQSGAYKLGPHPSNDNTRADLEISGGSIFGSEVMTANFGIQGTETTGGTTDGNNFYVGVMSTIMPGWNTDGDVWEIIRVMRATSATTARQAFYIGKLTDATLVKVKDVTATLNTAFGSSYPAMNSINITGKNFNRQLASTDTLPELWVSPTWWEDITEPGFTWPSQINTIDRI